jgi:hypothetical protein
VWNTTAKWTEIIIVGGNMHQHIEYTQNYKFCLITTISTPGPIKLNYSIHTMIHDHYSQESIIFTTENEQRVSCTGASSENNITHSKGTQRRFSQLYTSLPMYARLYTRYDCRGPQIRKINNVVWSEDQIKYKVKNVSELKFRKYAKVYN